jgi:hypothetical protein
MYEAMRAPGTVASVVRTLGCVLFGLAVTACQPVNDPSAGLPVEKAVGLIDAAPPSKLGLADLAEAFAFGSRTRDSERDALAQQLTGHTVEWEIPVADVGFAEGRFEISSPAIPTANRAAAVPVLRVVAFVVPRNPSDQQLLMSLRADETVRIRGIVQEVRSRRIVAIVPAIVLGRGESGGR